MCKCEESNNQINRESDDVIEHVRTKFTSRLWFSFPYHESQLFWETYKKIYVSWDKIVEVLFLAIDLWSRIWLFCLLINFLNFAFTKICIKAKMPGIDDFHKKKRNSDKLISRFVRAHTRSHYSIEENWGHIPFNVINDH